MLAVTLTLSTIISVMFLLVGGVIGYLVKEYVYERNSTYIPTHPEMFDENGQIIADDILAVRFENNLDDFQSEE
tara:strand:- start:276 stop:497 length:222 start_codon:yes stop_codon:yes gene_type:complete